MFQTLANDGSEFALTLHVCPGYRTLDFLLNVPCRNIPGSKCVRLANVKKLPLDRIDKNQYYEVTAVFRFDGADDPILVYPEATDARVP